MPMDEAVLRLPEVMARIKLSKSSIYSMIAAGTFPQPCSIGVKAKGWLRSEISDFIDRCAKQRPQQKKS